MTVLVTGAAGFVGSRLVHALVAGNRPVRAAVRKLVPYLPEAAQVSVDLVAHARPLRAAMDGVDAVVHLAGANEVAARRDPEQALVDTVRAAHRVATVAAEAGVRRVVYVSTVHVYGNSLAETAAVTEETLPAPMSGYAIARLTAEHVLSSRGEGAVVILRLTNSVGAPVDPAVDRWSLVANDLCRQGALTGKLELRTHGLQWRDFVPLDDVCRVLAAASEPEGLAPGTYNLGSGIPQTIRDLAGMIQDALEALTGRRPPLVAPEPPADRPLPYRVSVARLAEHGLAPAGSVRSAVEEMARFCIENREHL